MGLKVTRQTDLTSLFDKFASIPGDREKWQLKLKKRNQRQLKKNNQKEVRTKLLCPHLFLIPDL